MKKIIKSVALISIFLTILSCQSRSTQIDSSKIDKFAIINNSVNTGLDVLLSDHLNLLNAKNIALVTNHSGIDKNSISNITRILAIDSIKLVKIFSPEHGFTGDIPAGEHVKDASTISNLPPVLSLYGKTRKPTVDMLKDIDLIIYDIQDVGARFYTYISTMGLVIEAAAEAQIPVMVLDRPNPIGNKVDGPILEEIHKSFIGMYPIPIQYGMTVGELAKLIVGEGMISSSPGLTIIPMKNYKRTTYFDETKLPWVNPSPNIPDLETAIIYPGFCLFESTNVSEGRGTYSPFKQFGAPWIDADELVGILNKQNLQGVKFSPNKFTPKSISTMSKYPKFENIECYGIKVEVTDRSSYKSVLTGITTLWAINKLYPDSLEIKESSINRIWGSDRLFRQLQQGNSPSEIINSYQTELNEFQNIRNKYLIYN